MTICSHHNRSQQPRTNNTKKATDSHIVFFQLSPNKALNISASNFEVDYYKNFVRLINLRHITWYDPKCWHADCSSCRRSCSANEHLCSWSAVWPTLHNTAAGDGIRLLHLSVHGSVNTPCMMQSVGRPLRRPSARPSRTILSVQEVSSSRDSSGRK